VVTEDPDAIRIKREKEKKKKEEKEKAEKRKAAEEAAEAREEEEAREKARIAEKARRKAEAAEKKRKADAAAAKKKADAKKLAESLRGGFGDGSGKGKTGKPGNQGDPNGDPNSDILEGKSTGSGKVGGGLGSRGVSSAPKVIDNSQETGRVVVDVCVDRTGKVVSVDIRQTKTTTTSSRLKSLAKSNAKKYRFSKDSGAPQSQCGTITYDFKVK